MSSFIRQAKFFTIVLFIWTHSIHVLARQPNEVITVSMGVYNGTYIKYPQYMHADVCDSIPDFSNEQIDRPLGEIFIQCAAITSTGHTLKLKFYPIPNNIRGLLMLKSGQLDTLASSLWPTQIDNFDVYSSPPSIRKGEFEKGIYVSSSNTQLFNTPIEKIDIKKLTGLAVSSWKADLKVMKTLTSNLLEIEHTPAIFKLLEAGRADFFLLEFSGRKNQKICEIDICLFPLQGIKVAIFDSRNFAVSKKSKEATSYFHQLTVGMQKLRKQGKIYQLYQDMGFINSKVKDWEIINKKQLVNE